MGLPELRDSRSAKCAASLRMRSARRNRIRPRSCAVVCGHAPELNAAFAAATARSTSFSSASRNSPLMYILYLRAPALDLAFFAAIALALLATEPPSECYADLHAARSRRCHFAPAVHIEEKYGEPDEKRGPAEHPSFV